MAKRFTILKKSNGSEVHPLTPIADREEKLKEKSITKHTSWIFKVFSKTWKSGKGKDLGNDAIEGNTETDKKSEFSSSSAPITNEVEMNPFADSMSELNLNEEACTSNSPENEEASTFGRNLLKKMSLQKLMGLFATANRKRQELMKHKTSKNEIYLNKATTFIVGQASHKQKENQIDLTLFHVEEEQDIYNIKYEDLTASTTQLTTLSKSTNVKTIMEGELFDSVSAPLNTPQDQMEENFKRSDIFESNSDDAQEEEDAQNKTLGLLQSVCDKLISHDFNLHDNTSSLNINTTQDVVENNSESDLESESGEDSECESPNSNNSTNEGMDSNCGGQSEIIKENINGVIDDTNNEYSEGFLKLPKKDERILNGDNKNEIIGDVKDLEKMRLRFNTIQNLYTSLNAEKSETPPIIKQTPRNGNSSDVSDQNGCTENQKSYSMVEDDIKSMIKELLNESRTIKETIVLSGIAEESEPLFTYTISENPSLSVYEICKYICEELIGRATTTSNKIFNIANRKNIFTSKEMANAAVSDVRYIINIMLEQVLSKSSGEKFDYEPSERFVPVNFCLVNYRPLHNSKMYSAANKFWQVNKTPRPYSPKLPVVTIRNLSSFPKISVFNRDEKLVSRVRKSAALLLALYEEMRDYSYQCTSRLCNDLYEALDLLDLSKPTVEYPKPKWIADFEEKSASQVNNDHSESETVLNPRQINPGKEEGTKTTPKQPESSCSKSTSEDSYDVLPACSDSSLCSLEASDEAETSGILPNLRYTYISDEEINSAEEIEKIETNAAENSRRNSSLSTPDEEFLLELDAIDVDDVTNSFSDDAILDEDIKSYKDSGTL